MDIICSTLNPEEAKQAVAAEAAGEKAGIPDPEMYEEMFDYIFGNQDNKQNPSAGSYGHRNPLP